MLVLVFAPQGAAIAGIDFRDVLARLYPRLNAASAATLVRWTDAELYQWADEAAKRLARSFGVFVERDASTALVAGTGTYAAAARHVSTVHASADSTALYARTAQELEALDALYVETQAAGGKLPSGFLSEAGAAGSATRVYPLPSAGGTLGLIMHRYPAAIASSNYTLSVPLCLTEYFSWWMLAEARRKESQAKMPEIAEHFAERVGLLDQVIQRYWGDAR